ncbi:Clathrin coat assembly protein AP180, partial [Geodia barretti]
SLSPPSPSLSSSPLSLSPLSLSSLSLSLSHRFLQKFLQCIATRASSFELDSFTDRTDGIATEMSVFVRRYAKYLGYMCTSYKTLAMDLCRLPKGDQTPLRTQDPVKLLKTTSVVQEQMDLMMNMEFSTGDLTNGVVNTAFLMLYKDLIKLYAVYNDALINILEKFFEMTKPQCKEAMAAYKKFITRQEPVHKYLHLAEDVGVDKQSHLNLRQVPEDLLPALESHLTEMDSIKKAANAQPSPQIKAASEKLAQLHSSPSSSSPSHNDKTSPSAGATSTGDVAMPTASSDVLEAQRKRFEELKNQARSPASSTDGQSKSKEDSLFDAMASTSATKSSPVPDKKKSAMDDLAELQVFSRSTAAATYSVPSSSSSASNNPFQSDSFAASTGSSWAQGGSSGYQEVDLFSEIRGKPRPDFDSVFGSGSSSSVMGVQSGPPGVTPLMDGGAPDPRGCRGPR